MTTLTFQSQYKQYAGFSRDHSGSMQALARKAMDDYNQTIGAVREKAIQYGIDTVVSVVRCGDGHTGNVAREIVNSSIIALNPITHYETNGGTPLYDSVGELIEIFQKTPDANDPNVSFLVMAITDGQEMHSRKWNAGSLGKKIRELQATDRWTFVFRVPYGYGRELVRSLGLHEGNIQEWEQSTKGYEKSTVQTTRAFDTFYSARSSGVKSTSSFYTSMADVSVEEVKAALVDISGEVQQWTVQSAVEGEQIRDFVQAKTGKPFVKGTAFYMLVKNEDKIQDTKLIIIKDKTSGHVYAGAAARQMIGLPTIGHARVKPGDHGNFEIFVQSTSVNRKLPVGTEVLYWPNAV
jgi:hypothetical protein